MPALAMTDHGNVFGAYDFYKQANAAGVKPIIGMEGYYTPGSRFDRAPFDFGDKLIDEEGDGGSNRGKAAYTHMTLLARTTEGMHNLFRISSLASLEGQYRKPRFDRDLLERYGKGLIATTGCPSGEVNMWLRAGKEDRARQAAADFQDIFGKENFYAEIMDHGLSIEKKTSPALLAIAKDLGIPLLGTNDLHYTHQEDAAGPRRAAVHPDRLAAQRDQPLPVQRRRLLPEERRGDARAVRRAPRGAATTRCWSPSSAR